MYYIRSSSEQLQVFLLSVGFGYAVGFFYGMIFFRRKKYRRSRAADVKEFLFFAVCTFLYFSFLLCVDNGCFRIYTLAGAAAGFTVRYAVLEVLRSALMPHFHKQKKGKSLLFLKKRKKL